MNICFTKHFFFFCFSNIASLNTSFKNKSPGYTENRQNDDRSSSHALPFGGKMRSPLEGKKQAMMLLFCISALGRAQRISGADATQGHGSSHPSLQSPVYNVWRPFRPLPQFSQPNPQAPLTRAPPNLPPLFSQLSPTPQVWGQSSLPISNSASRDRGRGWGRWSREFSHWNRTEKSQNS